MHQLTNINSAILTMTSREIAELTGKELSHVHRDIREMLEVLKKDDPNLDHPREDKDSRGYTDCFHLGRELTITLVSGYSVVMRRSIVKRWQELEAKQVAPVALSTLDILNLAIESEKGRLAAVAQLAIAAPKAAFVDAYVDATGLKGFREVAKLLKANEARLREFLSDKKIMYRLGGDWVAYQQHIDAGRFAVKAGANSINGHAFNRSMFTPKGIEWLAGLWAVHCLDSEVAA